MTGVLLAAMVGLLPIRDQKIEFVVRLVDVSCTVVTPGTLPSVTSIIPSSGTEISERG
jgi:type III secretory pathway component EscS